MEDKNAPELTCTCGLDSQNIVYEDTGEMDVSPKENHNLDMSKFETAEKSDVDTDSLESVPISSPVLPEVNSKEMGITENEALFQNGSCDNTRLKSPSGSSVSDSCCSPVSCEGKVLTQKSAASPRQSKDIIVNGDVKDTRGGNKTAKKIVKTKTFDLGQVKARTNSNFNKQKDINKQISQKDRRLSESCILQTSSESHGIRETRLSRSRYEKCHEHHDSFECEGENYLTPTQRKDILLRDLKKEVLELKRLLSEKSQELITERESFEKKLELVLAEKGTEIVILKSDIETLEKKNEDLQKSYQVSINTINILEDNIRELKQSMVERDKSNEHVFLETYKKGQMSALFERNEELERIAVSCDGSSITIKELIQKLLLTETELGKWQSIRRQESYDGAPKPETEADVILRFLKDSFFHYATDSKDCDYHLRAIIRMLNFTDVQKKKIAEGIVAKRKNKHPPI